MSAEDRRAVRVAIRQLTWFPGAIHWVRLGIQYWENEQNVADNLDKAQLCCRFAQNIRRSKREVHYLQGLLVKSTNVEAAKVHFQAAANGQFHVEATKELLLFDLVGHGEFSATDWVVHGNRYFTGEEDQAIDHVKARVCYEAALVSDADNQAAFYQLGMIYKNGLGCRPSKEKARGYFRRLDIKGHIEAKKRMVELDMSDRRWWPKSWDWYNLGKRYQDNLLPPDHVKMLHCYDQALKLRHDHRNTRYNLGLLYELGLHGVAVNLETAKVHYEIAAREKHNNSRLSLAIMQKTADAVVTKAQGWFLRGKRYQNGSHSFEKNPAAAILCYQKALMINPRCSDSQFAMAQCYELQDLLYHAEEAYLSAANMGHPDGQSNHKRLVSDREEFVQALKRESLRNMVD